MPDTGRRTRLQAGVLLASAVLFAVTLRLVVGDGDAEPAHTVLKLVLLLAVPALLFRLTGRAAPVGERGVTWQPVVPVAVWFVLAQVGPLAVPVRKVDLDPVTLVLTVVAVFAVNALLEEVFYRRWLQTRWERVLGRRPAIVLTSLVFAAWHVGIQGTGHLPADLASAFVNQGVAGLFLGYLWSRYRLMWPILVVHGAMNATPLILGITGM